MKWTKEEEQYLKDNYYIKTISEISIYLNRTKGSIYKVINRLKLLNKRIPCDIDIEQKINRLTLKNKFMKNHIKWGTFECKCGKLTDAQIWFVVNNKIKSCGCYKTEVDRKTCIDRNTTHGKSSTGLHNTWTGIKSRCYNINNKNYTAYGWRGIRICDQWKNNFQEFYNWCLSNGHKKGLSIDRLDNNKDYSPDNCRWTNHAGQIESQHNNRDIIAWGEDKSLLRWVKDDRCKVNIEEIKKRLSDGWTTEDAISKII